VEQLTPHGARTRIEIEYIEMPDLKLTLPQLRRLCALPLDVCETAVAELVRVGFLGQTGEGMFLRRGLGSQADTLIGQSVPARSPAA
jgi:hypothetical protein